MKFASNAGLVHLSWLGTVSTHAQCQYCLDWQTQRSKTTHVLHLVLHQPKCSHPETVPAAATQVQMSMSSDAFVPLSCQDFRLTALRYLSKSLYTSSISPSRPCQQLLTALQSILTPYSHEQQQQQHWQPSPVPSVSLSTGAPILTHDIDKRVLRTVLRYT